MEVPEGTHQYKYYIDGDWKCHPNEVCSVYVLILNMLWRYGADVCVCDAEFMVRVSEAKVQTSVCHLTLCI